MQYDEVNEINKREKKPGESREEFLEILKVGGKSDVLLSS